MADFVLTEDRVRAINAFISQRVDPAIAQHNRYQHGFINGIIAMANVVFGEAKPEIEVRELYADAQASMKDLGHEGLCLLQEMPVHDLLSSDSADAWRQRREKLLECWHFNTANRLQVALNGDLPVEEGGAPEAGILVADGGSHTFLSKGGLHTLGPVERASKDGGGVFFRRLVIGPRLDGGKHALYAEHVVNSVQEVGTPLQCRHRRIGVISKPAWLRLEIVEEPCLSE